MTIKFLTVSQLIQKIKSTLEGEFQQVTVEGEVSNLSYSSSGHYYFNLSDKDASISCALFKMDALKNPLIRKIKDGDKIQCLGPIGVYGKRGTFQILVKMLRQAGAGDLKEQFELLKKKLAAEGLFDITRKKTIPAMAKRVAIITAPQGAALQDFLEVYRRRSLWMNVLLVPSLVQGPTAPSSLIRALELVHSFHQKIKSENPQDPGIDVIVFARGGGSMEDLWAFNDEGLARAIAASPIPIISAIGHQVDFSISDFVADFRSETPTAAAEALTTEQMQIKQRLHYAHETLKHRMQASMHQGNMRLERGNPELLLKSLYNRFYKSSVILNRLNISTRLYELTRLHEKHFILDETIQNIAHAIEVYKERLFVTTQHFNEKLKILGPQNVLSRGYSFLTLPEQNTQRKVLSSQAEFRKIPAGAHFKIHFHDGTGEAQKLE